jgi:hypothetical protein
MKKYVFDTSSLLTFRNESEISCSFHPADSLKNGCTGFRQRLRSADLSSGNRILPAVKHRGHREDTEGRRDTGVFPCASL